MIGCLRTRVHKQPIIALYFEFENDISGSAGKEMDANKYIIYPKYILFINRLPESGTSCLT